MHLQKCTSVSQVYATVDVKFLELLSQRSFQEARLAKLKINFRIASEELQKLTKSRNFAKQTRLDDKL